MNRRIRTRVVRRSTVGSALAHTEVIQYLSGQVIAAGSLLIYPARISFTPARTTRPMPRIAPLGDFDCCLGGEH